MDETVGGKLMRKFFLFVLLVILAVLCTYTYLYHRWSHLWVIAEQQPSYVVAHHHDDTLRVAMIGDSWAGLHNGWGGDSFLTARLTKLMDIPVKVKSHGKGGEKSGGIYRLMFEYGSYGTKHLLEGGADYCILFAGINDAAANLGTKQYIHHMRLILQFLFELGIKPVIVEIPDVDIYHLYGGKPLWNRTMDRLRSQMTGCGLYHFAEYREALHQMLNDDEWLPQRIVFVPMAGWNGEGVSINSKLFQEDRIHLNSFGYERLDSCIANAIAHDLQHSQNSTFVN